MAKSSVLLLSLSTLLSVGLTVPGPAQAEGMSDPTRPAAAWLAAQQPHAPGAEVVVAEPATPGIHIVVIGRTRKFAMVNGQAIRPGETYNGSRLVGVNDDGAVWQRDGRQEKTSMSPDVEKRPSAGQRWPKGKRSSDEGTLNGENK